MAQAVFGSDHKSVRPFLTSVARRFSLGTLARSLDLAFTSRPWLLHYLLNLRQEFGAIAQLR